MMISDEVFSAYSGCVEEVNALSDYVYVPPVPSVGRVLSDSVYNSAYYSVQPNFEASVISVQEAGCTYYYYPYVYYAPVYYVYPVVFHYEVLEAPRAAQASWSDEISYTDGYSNQTGEMPLCHYGPSEAVTTVAMCYDEDSEHLNDAPFNRDDDRKNDDDKKNNDDNGASSVGKEKSVKSPDCANESSAYKKFSSEMEERRKRVGASSQVQRTFVNRGIVKDLSSYNNFCRSVEDRIKKNGSPGKKSMDTDSVKESPNYMKFCSEVEDRRKILDPSPVRHKTYVNRGVVSDHSSYRKFCQSVEDRIKNVGSVETSPSSGIKKFIDKESSKGDTVIYDENGRKLMDRIMKSAEYLHVEDHIKNPKHYKDVLYRQALWNNHRRNNAVLFDILPSITEEALIFDDVTSEISCGDLRVIQPLELVSDDEITKPKKRKGRWKSFKNWWSKKLFCCFKTKDPP